MNPRFHLALSRWKPGFTWLAAGLTFMIKVSDVTPGARDHRVRDPAALDVSRPQLKRRIDLPVGQETPDRDPRGPAVLRAREYAPRIGGHLVRGIMNAMQPGGGVRRPQGMNRRFPVTPAALVALAALVVLAGCGSSKPGPGPSSAAPPAAVTTSAPASSSPSASAPPGTQAAGSIDVQDVSFVSARQGWALGSGELVATTDGGASWTRRPGPPAGLAHIRFASPQVGYGWTATGSLWITTNGAASWQPGRLTQVVSLETAAGWVWSIAGPQPYPVIWRAPVGSTAWTNLGVTPDRTATLTVHGAVAYVVGQQGAGPIAPSLEVFAGAAPVRHGSLPCLHGQAFVPFASLGVSTDGLVYLVCNVMNNQP